MNDDGSGFLNFNALFTFSKTFGETDISLNLCNNHLISHSLL